MSQSPRTERPRAPLPAREHLAEAERLMDAVADQVAAALEAGVPEWTTGAVRMAAVEAKVLRRRVGNLAKVLGSGSQAEDRG